MTTRKTKRKEKQPSFAEHLREMADRNPELERNAVFLCLLRDAEFDEECDGDCQDENYKKMIQIRKIFFYDIHCRSNSIHHFTITLIPSE